MSNVLLTPTVILREGLRLLHAKSQLIRRVVREYDDRFKTTGYKPGGSINIRKPVKFYPRTGAAMANQDVIETSVNMTVAPLVGVDFTFANSELTTHIDDFSRRYMEPAMSQVVSTIEATVLAGLYKQVSNSVGTPLAGLTSLRAVLKAKQMLEDNLAPPGNRTMLLNTDSTVELVDNLKGLFQSSERITEQYEKGTMGVVGGFNFAESTLLPTHTVGVATGTPLTDYVGAFVSGTATLVTNGWTASQTGILKAGDVFTIADVYAIHPETKATLGYLKQFTVLADANSGSGAGAATLSISPAPTYATATVNGVVTITAQSNVNSLPGNDKAITVIGTSGTPHGVNLAFAKEFAAFATVDLEDVSQFGAWGGREVYDGISMSIARQFSISSYDVPCRIDVMYAYAALYPELAVRVHNLVGTA